MVVVSGGTRSLESQPSRAAASPSLHVLTATNYIWSITVHQYSYKFIFSVTGFMFSSDFLATFLFGSPCCSVFSLACMKPKWFIIYCDYLSHCVRQILPRSKISILCKGSHFIGFSFSCFRGQITVKRQTKVKM